MICLDARHARAALRMQLNKTDRNDTEGLAQIMRAALDPRTRPTGRHIGRSARGELVLRGVFPAFEGGKRAASKVVWAIAGRCRSLA